jgi:hypothetical protein
MPKEILEAAKQEVRFAKPARDAHDAKGGAPANPPPGVITLRRQMETLLLAGRCEAGDTKDQVRVWKI